MRIKDTLFCDECGMLIRETTDCEKEQIKKDKEEGTRTSLDIICRRCLIRCDPRLFKVEIKYGNR